VTALSLDGITRSFGGVDALADVTFDVNQGARHVIFGPNGAGKTTLFRVITGEIPATKGTVSLLGRDVTTLAPWRRTRLGMGRTFQVTNLFFDLTVADNLRLACQAGERSRFSFLRPRRRVRTVSSRVEELLGTESLAHVADRPVRTISYGEQRLLEIALVLAGNPRLVLLDEPTSGVPAADAGIVMQRVRDLPPHITVVFIEHDLDIAFQHATTATVLGQGSLVAHGPLADVRRDPTVQELYLGSGNVGR
jgi:branched-chain amino acid transport system ATP-binding protein